jgi:hypothetical protein
VFTGEATCHEDDKDMASERTGCFIAECRAVIKRLQHIKNNELIPQIRALEHTLNILKQSTKCNPKSHEMRIIRRQLGIKKTDLDIIKNQIQLEKQYLSDYIKNKEIVYNRIRKANNK